MPETAAPPSPPRWAYAAAALPILAVRLIGLGSYPRIEADEGGWPLSVRLWVEQGLRTADYHIAPGYHWLLGLPFRLFGANQAVSRPVSALLGLVCLYAFYRLALRLAGARTALWSTLLLGVSYPAVLIDRRALMEPFQIALMLALSLAVTSASASLGTLAAMAGLTALLLLTKATAAYLLPALGLTVLAAKHTSPWWRITAMALGSALAAAYFGSLYLSDPVMFTNAWAKDLAVTNIPGSQARFGLNLLSIERMVRWYGVYEPILTGLALLGFTRAVVERRHSLMIGWLLFGGLYTGLQSYVQDNHRVMLMPPLCFFAGWLLNELASVFPAPARPARLRLGWAQMVLLLAVSFSLARLTGGILTARSVEEPAVRWLAAHSGAGSTVLAAPYVLMRLEARPVAFWKLDKPYLPTAAAVERWRADWVLIDEREWQYHTAEAGADEATLKRALAECCELAYSNGGQVHKVRRRPTVAGR